MYMHENKYGVCCTLIELEGMGWNPHDFSQPPADCLILILRNHQTRSEPAASGRSTQTSAKWLNDEFQVVSCLLKHIFRK